VFLRRVLLLLNTHGSQISLSKKLHYNHIKSSVASGDPDVIYC